VTFVSSAPIISGCSALTQAAQFKPATIGIEEIENDGIYINVLLKDGREKAIRFLNY
jgi:hypothetical protein